MKTKIFIISVSIFVILIGVCLLLYFFVFQNNGSVSTSTGKTTPLPTTTPPPSTTTPPPSTTTPPPSTTTSPPSTTTPPPSTTTSPPSTTTSPPSTTTPGPTLYVVKNDGEVINGGSNTVYQSNETISGTIWNGTYTNCEFDLSIDSFMFNCNCTNCTFKGTFISGTIGTIDTQTFQNCAFSGNFGDASDLFKFVQFSGTFSKCSFQNIHNAILGGTFNESPDIWSIPITTQNPMPTITASSTNPEKPISTISCIHFENDIYMYTLQNDQILRLQGNQNYIEIDLAGNNGYSMIFINTATKSFFSFKNDGTYATETYTDTPPIEIPDKSSIPKPNYENVDRLDIGQYGFSIIPFATQGFLQFYWDDSNYIAFILNSSSLKLQYSFLACQVQSKTFLK